VDHFRRRWLVISHFLIRLSAESHKLISHLFIPVNWLGISLTWLLIVAEIEVLLALLGRIDLSSRWVVVRSRLNYLHVSGLPKTLVCINFLWLERSHILWWQPFITSLVLNWYYILTKEWWSKFCLGTRVDQNRRISLGRSNVSCILSLDLLSLFSASLPPWKFTVRILVVESYDVAVNVRCWPAYLKRLLRQRIDHRKADPWRRRGRF